jgi:hypothetical protein
MERIAAGNVEFRVETREGANDGGPSIQVRATTDSGDVQLLRFDCFRIKPHYHYAPEGLNAGYDIDPTLATDSLSWVIAQLGTNLKAMIERAGNSAVAEGLDQSAVTAGLAEVEAHFRESKVSLPSG